MASTQQLLASYGSPFVGPLDVLVAQGAVVSRAFSQRRLLGSYTGPADILRGNGSGSPEATIGYLSNGGYDLVAAAAAAAAAGGTQAYRKTWHDQSGAASDASQTLAANQPPFTTSVVSKGAIGGIASTDCFLSFAGSISQPFFVYAVVTVGTLLAARYIVGSSSATSNYLRVGTAALSTQSHWGTSLTAPGSVVSAKSLATLANGASSALYVNGASVASGNAGANALPASSRIGSGGTSASSWFTDAGSTISELIIFSSDPTGLAGWSEFETETRSYYS